MTTESSLEKRIKKTFDLPESLALALAQYSLDERRKTGKHVPQGEIVVKALRRFLENPF